MTRASPPVQRKRKRISSPLLPAKLLKQDDDGHKDIFLSLHDAQNILHVLELSDTQGLLDRVFPSAHTPDSLVSLRTLLRHPTDNPLLSIKAAITNLRPISSLPRSRPSPAASQQLSFAALALNLIEQASFNAVNPPLDKESILDLQDQPQSPKPEIRQKYALVQHLPQGDYWSSLSADASPSTLKHLSTAHAELVAVFPSSTSVDPVPTLASVSSRPLGPTKKIQPQRRVSTGAFLDYGPWASFAPSFDHNGEVVGQHQLAQVIYQKELKKPTVPERDPVLEIEEDVVMEIEPSKPSTDLSTFLAPEDVQAIKQALGSLELENAVQELLERNQRALIRLEELQYRRYKKGAANFASVEEGSEEWETANAIMESLVTLASLRPRSDTAALVPPPAVLRKLHRSLALEPTQAWYGTLPPARTTALHDDSTIKVKSPTVAPATAPAPVTPAAQPAYSSYYGSQQQQQGYRPTNAYPPYKAGQASSYYQTYGVSNTTTQQQSYYGQQGYSAGSNQQPYGAATAQQPYSAYQGWYSQYQPNNAPTKTSTPTPVATTASYSSIYNAGVNGNRPPAVANTVATKPGQTAQTPGTWPTNYQTQAPTLPSHLRSNPTTATTAYSPVSGYYQAYQPPQQTPAR